MNLFNLFSNFKTKRQEAKLHELKMQAKRRIEVTDFDGKLYIAYDGTPVFPIEKEWTPIRIIGELNALRENYIKAKTKESVYRGMAVF